MIPPVSFGWSSPRWLLVMLALAASSAAAEADTGVPAEGPTPRVLVLDLEASEIEASQARLINGLVTDSMSKIVGFEVVSSADLRQLVEVEASKAAAGCDVSSCLADLAGAMGARFVVFGNMGRLGDLTVVTVSLFDTQQAKAAKRERVQVRKLEELPAALDGALARLMGQEVTAPAGPSPVLVGSAVGAAAGLVGTISLGAWALALDADLGDATGSPTKKQTALDTGPWVLGGAAVLALVTLGAGAVAVGSLVME